MHTRLHRLAMAGEWYLALANVTYRSGNVDAHLTYTAKWHAAADKWWNLRYPDLTGYNG